MTKSALQIARAAYQPKLPKALKGTVKAAEGAATQSVADQEEIKKLFPNTYGMPLIKFETTDEVVNFPAMNVGVILSGGQAPGGHNVISGIFDGIKKLNKDSKLYGFILGPGGLVDHNYMELTADIIDEYRNTGGFDIIGSGRTKLEKEEQFEKGYEILKELGIKEKNPDAKLIAICAQMRKAMAGDQRALGFILGIAGEDMSGGTYQPENPLETIDEQKIRKTLDAMSDDQLRNYQELCLMFREDDGDE